MKFFEVGGCVRDEILGVASKDIDYSVVLTDQERDMLFERNQDPFEFVANTLVDRGFKIFVETPEHLTVRAQFPKGGGHWIDGRSTNGLTADFVLARKEGAYSDGRRPDKVEPGTLEDDLARRDFTMNAIAKAADGSLIDPFNGRRDIERRLIRAVGDPMERLTEDALRAVRAIRFAQTKGFAIEKSLADAMESDEVLDLVVNKISDERIEQEVSKMFRHNTLSAGHILFGHYMLLTEAIFAGRVSLDSTMKTKGRGK
jgi:tRNA nucleotidyltransferase (CCA-adding enzyme)